MDRAESKLAEYPPGIVTLNIDLWSGDRWLHTVAYAFANFSKAISAAKNSLESEL